MTRNGLPFLVLDRSLVLASSNDDEEDKDEDEDDSESEGEEPVSRPGIGARSHHSSANASPVKVVENSLVQPPPAISPHVNGKKTGRSRDNGDPTDSKVTKKRKTDVGPVPTAIANNVAESNEESSTNPTKTKTKPGRKSTVPFERIKADKVVYADERLKDNTFESRVCHTLSR